MMKNSRRFAAVAAGFLGLLLLSSTASAEGRIHKRQERQQQRIGQGVESGQLTAGETARLEGREARLNREIRRDRADGGGLSPHERAKIDRQQDRLSRQIYRDKHNHRVRG
jgi:hypothetical protein